MKKIFCILYVFASLAGCVGMHPCNDINLIPIFVGYSKSDIDTLIFRAYTPNDSFNHLLDTAFISEESFGDNPESDTVFIALNRALTAKSGYLVLGPNYDWEIDIPAKNKIIHISKIVNVLKDGKGYACVNEIKSCDVDGELVHPTFTGYVDEPNNLFGYMIYLNDK